MTDLQLLLVLLVAFYLWECAQWIRRPGVVFRSWLGAAYQLAQPAGTLSNRLGGFIFAMPIPGLGATFAVQWPPILLTRDALIAHLDPLDLSDGALPSATARVPIEQLERIEAKRHVVWVNGRKFAAAGSNAAAQTLAAFIKELKATKPAAREPLIEKWLQQSLDDKLAAERINEWQVAVGRLGFVCGIEFALVVFAGGWLGLGLSLREVWVWFVGALVIINWIATVKFARAHRRLFPDALEERIQHTTMMALFPLATIRAVDVLSRPLLEKFHPLAVGLHLLGRDAFEQLAQRQLRRVRLWMSEAPTEDQPYFRQLEDAVVRFLRTAKVAVEKSLVTPPASDPNCRSFCPRCGSQFTFATGPCKDCGTIQVQPLASVR